MSGFEIVVSAEPSQQERDEILALLSAYNSASGNPPDMLLVSILLRDEDGRTVGGLWGKTVYDWLFVEFLIVPSELRGRSLGTELMAAAERLAIDRGCVGSWLTTFSYQARPFYEAIGYEVFAELPQSPGEIVRFFMRKLFSPDRNPV